MGHKQAKEEMVDLDVQFQRVKNILFINCWQHETDQSLTFWKQGDHTLYTHTKSKERENIKCDQAIESKPKTTPDDICQ